MPRAIIRIHKGRLSRHTLVHDTFNTASLRNGFLARHQVKTRGKIRQQILRFMHYTYVTTIHYDITTAHYNIIMRGSRYNDSVCNCSNIK